MNEPDPVHGLTEENLLRQFPIALQGDPSAAALAKVTARLLARRPNEIDRLRIYPEIYRLDEKLLDILAYDFKVDWWDANYTLEEKRRTLADSWRVHKILGTRAAVETAIRDIYPNTDVQEWFEYEDGKPYHFKLNIDLTDTFGDETRPWRVLERVNFYKSLRSHLDEIVFTMTTKPSTLHVGGGVGSIVSMGIPAAGDVFDFQQSIFVGGHFGADAAIGVPEGSDTFDFRHTLPIGGTVGTDTSIGVPAGADTLKAQASLYAGGAAGIHSTAGVSEEPDAPEFSQTVHAGGKASGHASLPVREDTTPPPSVTILRTGGVCTIISNRPKGD